MSNTMRWRYGDTNPVILAVDAATDIEIGDLIYQEVDDARPATLQADQGTLAANQELFHDNFVGVAMQSSPVGSAKPIRVATTGVFEFECQPVAHEVGDLLGIAEEGTGSQLEDQSVIGVATPNLAIGRCVKRTGAGESRVLVDVVSTVLKVGPQAAA